MQVNGSLEGFHQNGLFGIDHNNPNPSYRFDFSFSEMYDSNYFAALTNTYVALENNLAIDTSLKHIDSVATPVNNRTKKFTSL